MNTKLSLHSVHSRIRRVLSLAALVAALVGSLCPGCSGEFAKAWRLGPPAGSNAELLAGHWEGTWQSDAGNGHGPLQCIVTPLGDGRYEAQFHAIYGDLLTFDSTVILEARKQPGMWTCQGDKDLGLLAGGLYHYDGHSDGRQFTCTYTSPHDHGIFKLTRVPAATSQPAANR